MLLVITYIYFQYWQYFLKGAPLHPPRLQCMFALSQHKIHGVDLWRKKILKMYINCSSDKDLLDADSQKYQLALCSPYMYSAVFKKDGYPQLMLFIKTFVSEPIKCHLNTFYLCIRSCAKNHANYTQTDTMQHLSFQHLRKSLLCQ